MRRVSGGGSQRGAAGIERAGAGMPDSDGATSSQGGAGHSGVWGKCLVNTIGDVVDT